MEKGRGGDPSHDCLPWGYKMARDLPGLSHAVYRRVVSIHVPGDLPETNTYIYFIISLHQSRHEIQDVCLCVYAT